MLLAENIVHFSRVLRAAGLRVGPDRVLAALAAVEAVGLERREDVHAALSCVMIDRHEEQAVFDAAFDGFWCKPGGTLRPPDLLLARAVGRRPWSPARPADRAAPATAAPNNGAAERDEPDLEHERLPGYSARERLQHADFGAMSAAEYELATRLAGRLPVPVQPVLRRRHARSARGRVDLRRTLQGMARQPQTLVPVYTRPAWVLPPLVVLLDISGSMDRYARLFLHYVHGLMRRRLRVQVFTFGTRLTNITRCLRERDPDVALARADALVQDWRGGTRIASALDEFNHRWARRVLGANAAVLLVSDGLDRDERSRLGPAAAWLHRMAHQVVWLNPLLRFDGFEPRAAGVRALMPHVDAFLPVHDLASLADLGRALRVLPGAPAAVLRAESGRIRNMQVARPPRPPSASADKEP